MKKVRIALFSILLVMLLGAFPVYAAEQSLHLYDQAEVLTDTEEQTLTGLLDEISERQKTEIVIVTVEALEDKTAQVYADDFYDQHFYGADGILFLISETDREWSLSTGGFGINAFTDAGQNYIMDQIKAALSDGEYNKAFTDFATLCDEFITQARSGKAYDNGNLPKKAFGFPGKLIFSLAVGFVVSLIITGSMKSQLKTVHKQEKAADYVKRDRIQMKVNRDIFLYKKVEKNKKEQNGSKTHESSEGQTHGGSSGKF